MLIGLCYIFFFFGIHSFLQTALRTAEIKAQCLSDPSYCVLLFLLFPHITLSTVLVAVIFFVVLILSVLWLLISCLNINFSSTISLYFLFYMSLRKYEEIECSLSNSNCFPTLADYGFLGLHILIGDVLLIIESSCVMRDA